MKVGGEFRDPPVQMVEGLTEGGKCSGILLLVSLGLDSLACVSQMESHLRI